MVFIHFHADHIADSKSWNKVMSDTGKLCKGSREKLGEYEAIKKVISAGATLARDYR